MSVSLGLQLYSVRNELNKDPIGTSAGCPIDCKELFKKMRVDLGLQHFQLIRFVGQIKLVMHKSQA